MLLVLTVAALAAPVERHDEGRMFPISLERWEVVDSVVVLDVNPRYAAVRLIARQENHLHDARAPFSCGYAGMDKLPTSGVTLSLVDLATHTVTAFPVYRFAWTEDDCSTPEESSEALRQAKEAFRLVDLDIQRKPEPEDAKRGSRLVLGDAKLDIVPREPKPAPLTLMATATTELRDGDRVIYRRREDHSAAFRTQSEITFEAAYRTKAGWVLLERITHTSLLFPRTAYTLSPPIPLR